jgi:hypothetical protein
VKTGRGGKGRKAGRGAEEREVGSREGRGQKGQILGEVCSIVSRGIDAPACI